MANSEREPQKIESVSGGNDTSGGGGGKHGVGAEPLERGDGSTGKSQQKADSGNSDTSGGPTGKPGVGAEPRAAPAVTTGLGFTPQDGA